LHPILEHYHALNNLSDEMRMAAISGEWDTLIELQQRYDHTVECLKPADEHSQLDDASSKIKVQLLKKILSNEAEIRALTEIGMTQMKQTLQTSRQEQRLNKTYGIV